MASNKGSEEESGPNSIWVWRLSSAGRAPLDKVKDSI